MVNDDSVLTFQRVRHVRPSQKFYFAVSWDGTDYRESLHNDIYGIAEKGSNRGWVPDLMNWNI